MITPRDYWMGRDAQYKSNLTPEIQANAADLLALVNAFLEVNHLKPDNSTNGTPVTSGWRPPALNAATPNAALRSKHLTGQAIDLFDPEGALDHFCFNAPSRLAEAGLWLEHPAATKGWCHLQSVPPHSGNRVFYP